MGVQRAKKRDREKLIPEPELREVFLSLTNTNVETEAEMGQRIHTLLKYNVGAKWLLLNLAALYWRVIGEAAEATNCLRLAISWQLSDPRGRPFADVSLTQLAAMATQAGDRLDDGIVLMKQAVMVDSREPASHYLLGYYLALKRNFTGAAAHLTGALTLDPKFPGAFDLLKSIRCHQKYASKKDDRDFSLPKLRKRTCDSNSGGPYFFCLKLPDGGERCYLEEKFVQQNQYPPTALPASTKRLTSHSSTRGSNLVYHQHLPSTTSSPNSCEQPTCVAPPALAMFLLPTAEPVDSDVKRGQSGCRSMGSGAGFCGVEDRNSDRREVYVVEEEEGEVTLDYDNVETATGRELGAPPPVSLVKPPPTKTTVRYSRFTDDAEFTPADDLAAEIEPITEEGDDDLDSSESSSQSEGSYGEFEEETDVYDERKFTSLDPEEIDGEDDEDMEKGLDEVEIANLHLQKLAELAQSGGHFPTEQERDKGVFVDSPLPEVLPTPYAYQIRGGARLVHSLPSDTAECEALKKHVKLEQATSTWLSVTAKGVRLDQFIDFSGPTPTEKLQPICPDVTPATAWTMDHLHKFAYLKLDGAELTAVYKPEKGLKDAFQNLGNKKDTLQGMATRLARAMERSKTDPELHLNNEAGVHWSLTTVAALYWRVEGNLTMAIQCLRHALNNAPYHMRDLALVSMANVYHQAGQLHSGLITAGAALHLSPRFVVIHFTLANIYSAMGDLDHAMRFYYSTLALQNNFDPARERIRAIYCITGRIPAEAENVEDDV